jgi:hypothetical protein
MAKKNQRHHEIKGLYFNEGKHSVKEISNALAAAFDEDVPSDMSIRRAIKKHERDYTDYEKSLDLPWQLSPILPDGIAIEDVPAILKCVKQAALDKDLSPGPVTIREAQWVAIIWRSMTDAEPEALRRVALLYAIRSRWAVIEGKVLDTTDLDQFLAFGSWRGESEKSLYSAAIKFGLVTSMDTKKLLREMHPGNLKGYQESQRWLETELPRDAEEEYDLLLQQLSQIEECVPTEYKEEYSLYENHFLKNVYPINEDVLSKLRAIANGLSETKGGLTNA